MRDLPSTMPAIEVAKPGGPEEIRLATRPVPSPGEGEVLVRVAAAGVNRPDVLQRRGEYPPPPGAPDVMGLEIAGEIAVLGPGVSGLRVGDRVAALVPGGGYAGFAVAAAPLCLPIPNGLDLVEAAALPETFFTVWTNLFERGGCEAGDTVLIHGGTSGIGTTAIQLAAAFGARVFATAGSAEKASICERIGAERGIDYRVEDFVDVIRRQTRGRGCDVILDMVAGAYVARNLEAAAIDGRIVTIGLQGGAHADVDMGLVMRKRLTLTGSTLRPRTVAEKAAIADGLRRHVWPLLSAGKVRPIVHATFPLARAADAHRLMESSKHVGKIVLTIDTATPGETA